VRCGALEQTLRLRLVLGLSLSIKSFFSVGMACPVQYENSHTMVLNLVLECTHLPGLFRLFRPTSYLLRFGAPGRHTQAWASPPPPPVASLPHHHHCWLSASRWSAGRYLERFSSVPRAFLERFFERFWLFLGL
jgi:hypothetical protein